MFLRDFSWNGNERNRLLVNLGDGRFAEAAAAHGLDSLGDGRGLAVSDFDGDGDLDMIVNNYRGRAQYFVNGMAEGGWLEVRLRGRESNRDGIGAILRMTAGDRTRMRVVSAGDGYASQVSKVAHFGLGSEPLVDRLEIEWPSGRRQSFSNVLANRRIEIDEERGLLGK